LAVESLTIESDALIIIRLCEELLTISRNLKETWCLGTLKVNPNTEDKLQKESEISEVFGQFNELTERISRFETKNLNTI
jgi:mediator of RNA polymerase II transcription subunit 22, fungi type